MNRPLHQNKIGILGGASNIATGYYYQFINEISNARMGGWDISETVIAGMNFGNIEYFIRQNDWGNLKEYLISQIKTLISAGVDIIICVSNTLHKLLDEIMPDYNVSFIHIVDPTALAIQKSSLSNIVLLGTKPVMNMNYLKDRYQNQFDINIIVPTDKEQDDVDRIIFDELVKNKINIESKNRYIDIVKRLTVDNGAEGVILGCTEIFTLIDQNDFDDIKVFNTTQLHCESAVDFALKDQMPPKTTR